MDRGLLDIDDVADDYVHCVQCGGCEIRCPNTLFVGDFYQARTETVKVVRAARALMVDKGLDREGWKLWTRLTKDLTNEPVLGTTDEGQPQGQAYVRNWAEGLDIPIGGETIMFVDCEAAFYRTSNTRATAQVLQKAGVEKDTIAALGFPVSPQFATPVSNLPKRPSLGQGPGTRAASTRCRGPWFQCGCARDSRAGRPPHQTNSRFDRPTARRWRP
jgi:ferredoxin